jgi:MFS family permease
MLSVVICAGLKYYEKLEADKKSSDPNAPAAAVITEDQLLFQKTYLAVYVCAFFADWLKGPYVYALYQSYGYSESQIAYLFLAGFGASGLSGPFVGAAADVFGRRRLCIAYFVIYICSALTKPINNYMILLLGRLLGGLGTSLLYTVFESWMVAEHNRRGYPQHLLDDTFAKSTLFNGLSAVFAGLIAQLGASALGFVGPFMVALLPLASGLVISLNYWRDDSEDRATTDQHGTRQDTDSENGSGPGIAGAEPTTASSGRGGGEEAGIMSTIQDAITAMNADARIWFLGMAQSLFEGAMYTFVFLWTPALCEGLTKMEIKQVPYGLIFSTFMVMIMVGSSLFSMATKEYDMEVLPYGIHAISAACCLFTVVVLGFSYGVFLSFVLFELMCGIFFPTFGSLRAIYIPENQRSTIMNFFRVPLNLFVVIVLVNKHSFSNEVTFGVCMVSHLCSLALWHAFTLANNNNKQTNKNGVQYSTVSKEDVDQEADFGDINEEGDADL